MNGRKKGASHVKRLAEGISQFNHSRDAERREAKVNWLPDMDLNHDKQIQSLLCYRYTIGQAGLRT